MLRWEAKQLRTENLSPRDVPLDVQRSFTSFLPPEDERSGNVALILLKDAFTHQEPPAKP
jgi:hypothetical protein